MWVPKSKLVGFDTEATGLNPYGNFKRWGFFPARPFAFSFCDEEGNTFYIRWEVDPFTREVKPKSEDLRWLKSFFSRKDLTIIGHNISYDLKMLRGFGIEIAGTIQDTLLLSHVVTGGREFSYALKPLCVKYLDISDQDEADLQESTRKARLKGKRLGWCIATKEYHGKDPVKADYWMADPEICKKYAVQDAERTMMLYLLFHPELAKDEGQFKTYRMEMRLFHLVKKMEERGVKLFVDDMPPLRKYYEDYMAKMLIESEKHGGKGLNFKSPKQLVEKFYKERKHTAKLNKNGNPSLDGKQLILLADKDPLARCILEFRGANHMLTAFLNPYDRFRVQDELGTWVLHPNFRQCGPITGRFSCSDPNLMQVASEDTIRRNSSVAYKPKSLLGPREGHIWYLPDYKQIEVWVFAFLSQDEIMMKSLLSGKDFHGTIAEQVWSKEKDYQEHKSSYRKRAKLLMFCKIYGGGVGKIAQLLECSKAKAQQFVTQYDKELPGVERYMRRMIRKATSEGKLHNPFGRAYFIDPEGAYKAVNYMIQGTCADIMKRAMINVDKLFTERWPGCHELITLHDELICEIPLKYHSKKLMREIIVAMQADYHKVVGCPVPLPVSMEITSTRWMHTTEIPL